MSTLAVTEMLTSVFVPLGIAGAALSLICAVIAAFALARGSAGLAGGAVGVWIVGALLSLSASFASIWTPIAVALLALVTALVLGPVSRVLLARMAVSTQPLERELAPEPTARGRKAAPATTARKPVALPAASPRPVTDTVRIAS